MKAKITKGAIRLIAESELERDLLVRLEDRVFKGSELKRSTQGAFGEVYLDELGERR